MLKKIEKIGLACFFLSFISFVVKGGDLTKALKDKVQAGDYVFEGHVLDSRSYWNDKQDNIYTVYTIEVYKDFKGNITTDRIELVQLGGQVGDMMLIVCPSAPIQQDLTGIFIASANEVPQLSHFNNQAAQLVFLPNETDAIIAYDMESGMANNMENQYFMTELPTLITNLTGYMKKNSGNPTLPSISDTPANRLLVPVISSFSPTSIAAGVKEVLTIRGSGFNATRGTGKVEFKNSDDGGATLVKPFPAQYLEWSDTLIRVEIPASQATSAVAGSGTIKVTNSSGSAVTSTGTLDIRYSLVNFSILPIMGINQNGTGGYTFQYNTGFASNSQRVQSFERALSSWKCLTNVNFEIGAVTSNNTAAKDGINTFYMSSMGTSLGLTTTWVLTCGMEAFIVEIDMSFSNTANFNYDTPAAVSPQQDFESVALHELGHAMGLWHVNKTTDLMYWSIGPGTNKRTPVTNYSAEGGMRVVKLSQTPWVCSTYSPMKPINNSASISSDTLICPGNTVALTASGGSSYLWEPATGLNNSTTATVNASPTQTTTYMVTVKLPNTCNNILPVTVGIKSLPVANFNYTILGDSVYFTNTSTNATSFTWDFNDSLNASTNVSTDSLSGHRYSANGNYNVRLISSNDCDADTTYQTISLTNLAVKQLGAAAIFNVYPNPFNESLMVEFSEFSEDVHLSLYDMLGRKIDIQPILWINEPYKKVLRLDMPEGFSTGMYVLKISTATEENYAKMVLRGIIN